MENYDLILVQPPLFKPNNFDSISNKIELEYWSEMEKKAGKLLGDLPAEPSYGILSIATYLTNKNYKVKIIDLHLLDFCKRKSSGQGLTKNEVFNELKKYKASLYGITVMTMANSWANTITNYIRQIQEDTKIFWGGYYPTTNYSSILKTNRNIDFIVRYEGEYTIEQIIKCTNNESIKQINNIAYLADNQVIVTNNSSCIEKIDTIGAMNYDLYDEELRKIIVPRVYTTRGCKNSCIYCTANNSSEKIIRQRDVKLVVDEIENLLNKYDKKFFVMGDLEFLLDRDYSIAICQEIIDRNLNVKWWCQVYPPHVDEEVIKLMKDAGNIQIALGIESSNEKALAHVNKTAQTNTSIKACKIIKSHGIQIQAYMMVGLPEEDMHSIMNTIEFAGDLLKDNLIDVLHFSIMVPYPGSALYTDSEKYNIEILTTDPNKYYMNCDFLGSDLPVYNTYKLSNKEIYTLWLFGIAHFTEIFKKKSEYENKFKAIYDELGLNKLSILDMYNKTMNNR